MSAQGFTEISRIWLAAGWGGFSDVRLVNDSVFVIQGPLRVRRG